MMRNVLMEHVYRLEDCLNAEYQSIAKSAPLERFRPAYETAAVLTKRYAPPAAVLAGTLLLTGC